MLTGPRETAPWAQGPFAVRLLNWAAEVTATLREESGSQPASGSVFLRQGLTQPPHTGLELTGIEGGFSTGTLLSPPPPSWGYSRAQSFFMLFVLT